MAEQPDQEAEAPEASAATPTAADGGQDAAFDASYRRWALRLLFVGLPLVLAHAFVPLSEFVHRGDDAYYYFKLAVNYPEYGFWTFDGIRPTNGVQPLWGSILTGAALVLDALGITDVDVNARVFVALAALCHFASCMLLFRLVARYVSVVAGVAAAGAFLFPLGIVWTHVWGMENSLYALVLLSVVSFYEGTFRAHGTPRNAALLGLLLGAMTLSRQNSGFLIPILMLSYLCSGRHGGLRQRVRLCLPMGIVASVLVLSYLGWNLSTTGHPLSVAGGAKAVRAEMFMADHEVEERFSGEYFDAIANTMPGPMSWFITSRAMDGTWIAGGRALHGTAKSDYTTIGWIVLGLLLAPLLALRPRAWLQTLGRRFRALARFHYLLALALVNAAVSLTLFPYEITYPIVRWWLVESEILIITVMAVLTATSLGFLCRRWVPARVAPGLAAGWLALLVAFHAGRMIDFYFDGETQFPDWNVSTNDERLRAALWMRDNLPPDAVVGCWNAGVIGFYSDRHVVNLDGLINSWDFIPYLAEQRMADYLLDEEIGYLTDTDFELNYRYGKGLKRALFLKPIYSQHMDAGTGLSYRDQMFWVCEINGRRKF